MAEDTAEATAETTDTAEETTDATADTTEDTGAKVTAEKEASQFNWREGINDPDAMKMSERYDTNESAMKALVDMRKQVSKAVVMPGKKSDDNEWHTYRKNMGIPQSPEEYKYEGFEVNDNMPEEQRAGIEKWNKVFHESNIPSAVAQRLFAEFQAEVIEGQEQVLVRDKDFAQRTDAQMRKDWGEDYDTNKEYANRAVTEYFGPDFDTVKQMEMKDGSLLMDQPFMVRMFGRVGREMGEARIGEILTDNQVDTIEEQIEDLQTAKQKALDDGNQKQANKLDQKQAVLYAKIESGKSK